MTYAVAKFEVLFNDIVVSKTVWRCNGFNNSIWDEVSGENLYAGEQCGANVFWKDYVERISALATEKGLVPKVTWL